MADLSHWINVAETDTNDPDLTQVIEDLAHQTYHVHCRVGYDHGPQVFFRSIQGQNQPKSHFLFHKNVSLLSIHTIENLIHRFLIHDLENGWHTLKAMKDGGTLFGRLQRQGVILRSALQQNLDHQITKFATLIQMSH